MIGWRDRAMLIKLMAHTLCLDTLRLHHNVAVTKPITVSGWLFVSWMALSTVAKVLPRKCLGLWLLHYILKAAV